MKTNTDKIKSFLQDAKSLSIGYSELTFFERDNLENEQIGFSKDIDGNSLVGTKEGDWEMEWIAIGIDQLGDPIIVDCSDDDLSVYTAQSGLDEWELCIIADSLSNFKSIIVQLLKISTNRNNPLELAQNPISNKIKEDFITKLEIENKIDPWYWIEFLNDED